MPQAYFTPRHIVDAVKASDGAATKVILDPAATRVDWVAIAKCVASADVSVAPHFGRQE